MSIPNIDGGQVHQLSSLEKNDIPLLFFPLDTEQYGTDNHGITFHAMEYGRENRNSNSTARAAARIRLPVPGNLQTGYSVQHGDTEIGAIGNALADDPAVGAALNQALAGDGTGALEAAMKTDVAGAAEGAIPRLVTNIVQGVGNFVGVKAVEAAQLQSGMVINPHLASMFQGVGFRNHTFSYDFVAKDASESKVLRDIIYVMKYCMHPGLTHGGNTFTFPYEWKLKFSEEIKHYLYDFTTCVLTSFTVSYNGQGIPTFFEDTKAPVNIKMDFSFKETEIITRERIDSEHRHAGLVVSNSQRIKIEAGHAQDGEGIT